jgi:hypothetical protein
MTVGLLQKEGKKFDCQFEDNDIYTLCAQFKAVFLLCDGEYLVTRKHHPDYDNIAQYCKLVTAAVHGHKNLICSITPKVHYMWRHVEEQMGRFLGGLGIRWRIGWKEDIKLERDIAAIFAQCKILPNVLRQEQNWSAAIIICR